MSVRCLSMLFILVVPACVVAQDSIPRVRRHEEVLRRYVGSWKLQPQKQDALRQGGSVSSKVILDGVT
jgi:hypothetical protein